MPDTPPRPPKRRPGEPVSKSPPQQLMLALTEFFRVLTEVVEEAWDEYKEERKQTDNRR